jgi:hypothetical protein
MANETHEMKALRFLRATGGSQMAETMFDTLTTALRPALRPMPDEWWREFRRRFDPEEMIRLIAPRYAALISPEELDSFLEFFESPAGERYVALTPALTQAGMDVGRAWGERAGAEAEREAGRRRA